MSQEKRDISRMRSIFCSNAVSEGREEGMEMERTFLVSMRVVTMETTLMRAMAKA